MTASSTDTPGAAEPDLVWLRKSFDLSLRSRVAGDQPFGALLVGPDDSLLAEALNTRNTARDLLAHAEANLVRAAAPRFWTLLPGSTLYSSVEPCMMCAGAIAWSSIGRVVFGLSQKRLNSIPTGRPPRFQTPTELRGLLAGVSPPVTIVGPLLEDEALVAHEGYWQ